MAFSLFKRHLFKFSEMCVKLKEGKMNIELGGHFSFKGSNEFYVNRIKKDIIDVYEESFKDGDKYRLDSKLSVGSKLPFLSSQHCCHNCGKSYALSVKDENTLTLSAGWMMRDDGEEFAECEFKDGPLHTSGVINITDRMIICNVMPMHDDAPEGKKYDEEYSLNTFFGRKNITKWKVKNQNVAYGQMGNMGLFVYVNKNKDHVILVPLKYEYAENNEDEIVLNKIKALGFEPLNSISLRVWRWEATDVKTVEAFTGDSIGMLTNEMQHTYQDFSIIDVKKGQWEFHHYYDTGSSDLSEFDFKIYAELKLKK